MNQPFARRSTNAPSGQDRRPVVATLGLLLAALGCASSPETPSCDLIDAALVGSSFVVVAEPVAGASSTSPLLVRGCSRTFESNVLWQLEGRNGDLLASGHTSGGGAGGAAAFSFTIDFETARAQLGHLAVFEEDASDGEGFPPASSVVPVVLIPGRR
jgi:hypothetical protein